MALLQPLSPRDVLAQVAQAIPPACRPYVIIVGSLAAGYHFFANDGARAVRTKDVDCMFSPHAKAVAAAQQVTHELLAADWVQRSGEWSTPGSANDPVDKLPMVRLKPPGGSDWFVELLGAPSAYVEGAPMKQFHRIETPSGDFAICSFGFLSLAEWEPIPTQYGVSIARPEMMALANLLHHPSVGSDLISGTDVKRANKDLGRVLALAYLTVARDRGAGTDELAAWPDQMWAALRDKFGVHAEQLAHRAGSGLRELLASPIDRAQALAECNRGLLASQEVGQAAFDATGRRFVAEVVEPLEAYATSARP